MNLLTVEKVSKSFTDKILLNQVSFGIQEKDKIGLIGLNGTGKSTILKIVSGLEEADIGTVTKGKQVTIEYLPQIPEFDDSLSILENVVQGRVAKKENWNINGEARAMLSRFGMEDPDRSISILSGGQKKRAALVRMLLSTADLLVLDEPTNHLDNSMSEWLQEYLIKFSGALLMVTHDRYFLDRVTNQIMELEAGNIYTYVGGYETFLEKKAEREEREIATERKKASLYRKDLEWIQRGARARSTKQKAHIARFEELRDRKKPEQTEKVEISSMSARLGKKTLEADRLTKSYGEKLLFKDFSYLFLKRDRIGIIGKNGCGKSTLLNILNGMIEPDSGKIIKGETVKIGYFSQENEPLEESVRVIDFIKNVAEYVETEEGSYSASRMLERFLFSGGMQYSLIGKLSGGEKRRLYLLRVLMESPNILILDEPTNDLDIQTLSILEDYLDSFQGIVIAVSHDRYFLDRVVNRILSFEENGEIRQYEGGYTDFQRKGKKQETEVLPVSIEGKEKQRKTRENPKVKFSYQEQREYEEIDNKIEQLEQKISELDEKIQKEASNYLELDSLFEEKEKYEKELSEKWERWVYLNDLAEQIKKAKENQ